MTDRTRLERIFGNGRRHLVAAVGVTTLAALAGLARLDFSDDYREIFRSDSESFALLEEVSATFGADEQRILVLVEAPDLFREQGLQSLERIRDQIEALGGVVRVESPLSVSGLPRLLAAAESPDERDRIAATIRSHPLLGGQLVADDLGAALVVAEIDPRLRRLDAVEPVLRRIEAIAASAADDGGIRAGVTGIPAMRAEVVRSVQRDQIVFTGVGLVLGGLIALAAFRHPVPALVIAIAPVLGMLWTMGALGWLGQPIDVLNNVVPVLVLVIGMTDSVHLVRSFQECRGEGLAPMEASLEALRRVGKACALTSATTVVGFSSLALSEVESVRRFGLACALGLALSFLAVTSVVPLLTSSRIGAWVPDSPAARLPDRLLRWPLRRARAVSAVGLAALALLAIAFWRLAPDYRYREFLAEGNAVRQSVERIEARLGGAFPLHVVVDWDEQTPPERVLEALHEIDDLLSGLPNASAPFSILNPIHALVGGDHDAAEEHEALAALPAGPRSELYRPDLARTRVSVRLRGENAAALRPVFAALEVRLAEVEIRQPGIRLRPSGMLYVSTGSSLRMIGSLFESLLLAGLVLFGILCWGLRSLRLGILSIAPNLLPIAALATVLVLSDRPLQFTTVTLFTLGLALAVDDTIHVLVDFQRRRRAGLDVTDAVRDTLASVGPALVTTSALLVAGFGAVGLSQAPLMSLFGWLGSFVIAVALVADLVLLPALVVTAGQLGLLREPAARRRTG